MENNTDNGAHSFTEGAEFIEVRKTNCLAAEIITVKAILIIELQSKMDWVNKIPNKLPTKIHGENFLFIDKNGNALFLGLDFQLAEEHKLFPVKVYRLESIIMNMTSNKQS